MPGPAKAQGYQFGTFKGVFTPSILTILGVVMYLRLGWVLGNVGLPTTLVVVTVACSITFLTGLSLSALATNMKIGGGGAYFIISRSLGVEAGAAVGLPLYLAQALGISFYIAGFSESLVEVFPHLDPLWTGLATLVLLAGLVYVSADLALKSQFLIMAAIAVSLVSLFAGGAPDPPAAPPEAIPATLSFWPVFAVFFPAVTGIEAGIAMSGDLKNPARSLPTGTITAIVTGYLVYLAIPIFLAAHVQDRATLLTDPLVLRRVARWGDAILVGVWAASLSSAMGALLGAPRTLQALARDRVVPTVLGRGYGRGNDPRLATLVSFGIAVAGLLLGGLNVIAPVLSMFFLTSYGVLNFSAGMEEAIGNPAWRPRFRIPAGVSLAGFAACGGVMLMIAPGSTIIAGLICAGIYYMMKRRSLRARWGDMRFGVMMFGVRELLHRMQGRRHDERTWKPNLLVLSGSPAARWYLIELADAVAQGRSFVTVATVVSEKDFDSERARKLTKSIRDYLGQRNVPAFIRALPSPDPYTGAESLVRCYGFGPITPNTVLIGVTEKPSSFVDFARLVLLVARTRRNLVIVRESVDKAAPAEPEEGGGGEAARRCIDLWWGGLSNNMSFMLALAHLLQNSEEWDGATLRLGTVVDDEEQQAAALERLEVFVEEARLRATPRVLAHPEGETAFELISRSSSDADLVFLGMRPPEDDETAEDYSRYYAELLERTQSLPATALVTANEGVDFRGIFATR